MLSAQTMSVLCHNKETSRGENFRKRSRWSIFRNANKNDHMGASLLVENMAEYVLGHLDVQL